MVHRPCPPVARCQQLHHKMKLKLPREDLIKDLFLMKGFRITMHCLGDSGYIAWWDNKVAHWVGD